MTHSIPPRTNELAAPWYRREMWLAVCLASFVPVCIAIVAPPEWKVPLIGLAGAVMMASIVMLIRQYRQAGEQQTREGVRSDQTTAAG